MVLASKLSPDRQNIKTDVADSRRLCYVKLDNGHVFAGAFGAQESPTVPAGQRKWRRWGSVRTN